MLEISYWFFRIFNF